MKSEVEPAVLSSILPARTPGRRGSRRALLLGLALAPIGRPLIAQTSMPQASATPWVPDRPLRLILPFAAGGGTDQVARLVMERLRHRLGQSIVIDNRGGANGIIAARAAGTAPPDGYTLFFGAIGTHAINPHIYPQLSFNPDEFVPIAAINTLPTVFVVAKDGRAQTLEDVVKLGKSGQGNYGHWAIASVPHIAGEMFKKHAGIPRLEGIPFQGAAQCLTALIGGHIDIANLPLSLAQAYSDRVKILGLASSERLASAPDIPTMAEAGYPVDIEAWYGVFAPPGTPKEIVETLSTAINATVAEPELHKRMIEMGMKPQSFPSPEAYSVWLKGERDRWGKVLKDMGISAT
jgi:tripartite-type tricarboxylate transporter receptor subunit TctC